MNPGDILPESEQSKLRTLITDLPEVWPQKIEFKEALLEGITQPAEKAWKIIRKRISPFYLIVNCITPPYSHRGHASLWN